MELPAWLTDIVQKMSFHGYRKTSQESHDDELLLHEEKYNDELQEQQSNLHSTRSTALWLKWLLYAALFVLYSFFLISFAPRKISDRECASRVSLWSPLNDAVEYIEYELNNDFDEPSEYRGPPTKELEEAWDDLWRFDPVPFPEDKLNLVNRSEEVLGDMKLARLGPNGTSGPVAANFEIFHQLHCLNFLRQYTWRDWYFRHPAKVVIPQDMLASDVGVRIHADHCIEHIRKSIMCNGDTTPFFTYVDPDEPMGARGDFSAHHKCKDFEKLQEWTRDHGQAFRPFKKSGQQGSHHHV